MDSKLKLKIFGIATFGLAVSSLLFYLKERKQPIEKAMISLLEELREMIEDHFKGKTAEEMSMLVQKTDDFVQYLSENAMKILNFQGIEEEIIKIDFINQLPSINKQINQLLELQLATQYLKKNSLQFVQENIIEKLAAQRTTIVQQVFQIPENTSTFIDFIQKAFIELILNLETLLLDLSSSQSVVAGNFLLLTILDYLDKYMTKNPCFQNLLAILLLQNLQQAKNIPVFKHDCQDLFYTKPVKTCEINEKCECCIFDLLCRYISLLTRSVQEKLFNFLKKHQIFQTKEHLEQTGKILLKNSFYLSSQLSEESLHYSDSFSSIHNLLIEAMTCPSIQVNLGTSIEFSVHIQYIERVISSHNNDFLNKILGSLIENYVITYPLFHNTVALQQILGDSERVQSILSTFFGVLLSIETKDTFDPNQKSSTGLLDWFANSMSSILQGQILGNIQVQFIVQLLKIESIKKELLFTYLYCLRVSQNKRIQDKQQRKKNVDVNAPITKLIGLIVTSQLNGDFSLENFEASIGRIGFVDEDERLNIMTNVLRILYDMPSANINYLKYVAVKCQQLGQQAIMTFNGYYTNILSSQTMSYDQHMFSMQLGVIYGRVDSLLVEVGQRFLRDLQQFDTYKDFLLRDIIMIVDLMENPNYFINILVHLGKCPAQQYQNLLTKAAISLWQLQPKMNQFMLLDSLQLFVKIDSLPQYVLDLFDISEGNLKLKEQFENLWPFMSLQKDMETALLYLKLVADEVLFNELLEEKETFTFITKIQQQFFNSNNFIQIIYQCLFSVNRVDFKVWLAKILFYASKYKNIDQVNKLLSSKECQSFIIEMPENYRKHMLN